MFVYTLKLEDSCYYVGTTKHPARRLKQHRQGLGCEWTQEHEPLGFSKEYPLVKVDDPDENFSRLQEDLQTKRVMLEKGIDRVRGGSYARAELSRADVLALAKELYHAKNACLRCGRPGHWATACFAVRDVGGNAIEHECAHKRPKRQRDTSDSESDDDACFRCGRSGHWASECYAKRDIDGRVL
jgi:hypothetical protein